MKRLLFILILLAPMLASAQALQRWERIKPISAQVAINNPAGADLLLIQDATDGHRKSIRLDSLLNLVVTHPEATLITDDTSVFNLNQSTQEFDFNSDRIVYGDNSYAASRTYTEDDLLKSGFYWNNTPVSPFNLAHGLIHAQHWDSPDYAMQLGYRNGVYGIRDKSGGVWSNWNEIWHSGNLNLEDASIEADFYSLSIDGTDINQVISDSTKTITSTDGSVNITPTGTNYDLSVNATGDGYINGSSFNTGTGVFTLTGPGAAGTSRDLDGRWLPYSGGTITGQTTIENNLRVLSGGQFYISGSTFGQGGYLTGGGLGLTAHSDLGVTLDYDNTYNLKVNSSGVSSNTAITATNFILSSDKRLKKNIINLKRLEWADNIKFKKFRFKADDTHQRYGVIAQELEQINPELVRKDTAGIYSVAYIDLLVAKAARHNQQITELQKQVKYLSYERIVIIIVCIALFFVAIIRTSTRHA